MIFARRRCIVECTFPLHHMYIYFDCISSFTAHTETALQPYGMQISMGTRTAAVSSCSPSAYGLSLRGFRVCVLCMHTCAYVFMSAIRQGTIMDGLLRFPVYRLSACSSADSHRHTNTHMHTHTHSRLAANALKATSRIHLNRL